MNNPIETFAAALSGRSIFRDNPDYQLFLDVPAHCLTVKKAKAGSGREFSRQVIDLLVCRGDEAILALVVDGEEPDVKELFSTHLQKLPHEFLKSEELGEALCADIEFRLHCDWSKPVRTGCTLQELHIQYAVSRMKEPDIMDKARGSFRQLLEDKHLIRVDGGVTGYGRDCGVFRHWLTDCGQSIYVTVPQAIDDLKRALLWRDSAGADGSLKSRLARLEQGLPSGASQREAATIRKVLQTPLEELFRKHPEDGNRMNAMLNHVQFLSRESAVSAFGDREDIETYGDVLYAVRNLWEYTARGSSQNARAAKACEALLATLSFPIWTQPAEEACEEAAASRQPGGEQSLQSQLDRLHCKTFDYSFGAMPLAQYFYAAACVTESEYPIWLYSNCVKPWLELYGVVEPNLARAMSEVYQLALSDGESQKEDFLPLMYEIMVEPFTGIL